MPARISIRCWLGNVVRKACIVKVIKQRWLEGLWYQG